MDYRVLTSVDDLQQVVDLEIAVWGVDPRDAVPANIMRPLTSHGGLVLGAYDDQCLIGMSLAFPARVEKRWILWSHMAGVHPEYQGRGIGFGIKQAQRRWALENGYSEMRWTFDPLQRGNAHFNLHLLGATTNTYHTEYYGVMNDLINRGVASDRVEARWKLADRRVKALAQGKSPQIITGDLPDKGIVLYFDGSTLVSQSIHGDQELLLVEIPRSRSALPPELLRAWQHALRQTLQSTFDVGYTAVDFVERAGRGFYVLQASKAWYMYVLRCADDTLYTGITPDLKKRYAAHQAGRGAGYTLTRRPVTVVGAWRYASHSSALKAEAAFKQLSRAVKLHHIAHRIPFHNVPAVDLGDV